MNVPDDGRMRIRYFARTYGPSVEAALEHLGLDLDSSAPNDWVESRGWRCDPRSNSDKGSPNYHHVIYDADDNEVGDGWGDSAREAFLAAVASAMERENA